jgi:V8-like Glu-specific endopeptidase
MNLARSSLHALAPLLVVLLAGCGPEPEPSVPEVTPAPLPTAVPSASASAAPAPDLSVPPVLWANPGGMWMPEQVATQGETLKKIGVTLDPAALGDPTAFPLGAVVSLGGCSASFVSAEGLIITNHHCVVGALQYSSTEKQDLITDGYLARTRADERSNGPASRVLVTSKFTDVTARVRDGLDRLKDDKARYQAIEDRQKALVRDCEKGREGVKCTVARYFEGARYTLIEQLELRDVRLVYAPPEGIGDYGKETDNWRWPRHAGDFGFFRAYVGKDGKPADYAADNVPFKPAHHLKVATTPLEPGAAVMVAGYPGETNRLSTAAETREAISWEYPHVIDFTTAYLAKLAELQKGDKNLAIKAETFVRGLGNTQTNTKGELDGLVKGGLGKKKEENEAELKRWIDADPARKRRFGGVLEKMDKLEAERSKTREAGAILREATAMSRLFKAACTIVRNAEEREKPDAERDPVYQDRNQARLVASFKQLTHQYHPDLDTAMLTLAAQRDFALPPAESAGLADAVAGSTKKTRPSNGPDKLAAAIFVLFSHRTKLGDEATRLALLEHAKLADLKKSEDRLIKLALDLRPTMKAFEERSKRFTGAMSMLRPIFVEALKEKQGGNLAPDANGTLRITYGTVRGYAPAPGAPVYYPFTKLSELVAKNQGKDDFDAPRALLDAHAAHRFGAYVDRKLAEVPVDFLSDVDTTGGNSGSPTLDGKGELVGLLFDGNYESMASDWLFMPEVTRSIHVDIRYVLWVADAVSHADDVLAELGVTPSAR